MAPARFYRSSRRRTSRWLLALLAVVVAIGGTVYVRRNLKPHTVEASALAPANSSNTTAAPGGLIDSTASHALLPVAPTGKPADAPKPPPPAVVKPATVPAGPPLAAGAAQKVLADAKVKGDAGDLLGARGILNDALNTGRLQEADADAVRKAAADLNAKLIFSPQRYNDPTIDVVQLDKDHGLVAVARQHAIPWEGVCRINNVSDRRLRLGQSLKVPHGPFHVVVTKHAFRLDLYLGGLPGEPGALYVTSLPVGLGKDDSTPTGAWSLVPGGKGKNLSWTNPRGNERFAGDDPKNPLGGFWIGIRGEEGNALGKQSYGIHGTIEPDSIGKQASMGCIRLRHDDIALVYDLVAEGKTRVLVKD